MRRLQPFHANTGKRIWAIEIKRSLAPRLEKGYHVACQDISPKRHFVVYSGEERYLVSPDLEAVSLRALMAELAAL